jgi:CubicO group peptidase (beta-lactamase class C family)
MPRAAVASVVAVVVLLLAVPFGVLAQGLPMAAPERVGLSSQRLARIGDVVRADVEKVWSGLGGTTFWVDPKEELVAIWMMQAPNQRSYYRQVFRELVYQAVIDQVGGPDMAPHTPPRSEGPGEAGALLDSAIRSAPRFVSRL